MPFPGQGIQGDSRLIGTQGENHLGVHQFLELPRIGDAAEHQDPLLGKAAAAKQRRILCFAHGEAAQPLFLEKTGHAQETDPLPIAAEIRDDIRTACPGPDLVQVGPQGIFVDLQRTQAYPPLSLCGYTFNIL